MTTQQQPVDVFVQHVEIVPALGTAPLRDATVRRDLRRLHQALAHSSFVPSNGILPLWLDSFAEHLRQEGLPPMDRLAADAFDAQLKSFHHSRSGVVLEAMGSFLHRRDGIAATRLRILANGYGDKAMLSLRATIAASGLGHAAFSTSAADIYHEQNAIMLPYTTQSLVRMMIAVLITVFLLSADITFTLAMAACILSCCTCMIGWMQLVGVKLNALSLIPLLLSVGLCMDSSSWRPLQ